MFIALEGIDGSGKSSIAKPLAEDIEFLYTREPTFTSEQADSLNLESKNDIEREIEFAVDRIRHVNDVLRKYDNVICDRYIWSGLAYCSIYNPVALPFAEALYKHKFFPKPDVYIFVDTPEELCHYRRNVQPIEHLKKLREAYIKTRPLIESQSKIVTISGAGTIEQCVMDAKRQLRIQDTFTLSKREIKYRCGCTKEIFGFEKTTPPDLCEKHGEPIDGESNMVERI